MNNLLLYFILANLGLAAFYLFFRLFLYRDTFFREKRIALILGLVFALSYPIIDVSGWLERSDKAVGVAQQLRTALPDEWLIKNAGSETEYMEAGVQQTMDTQAGLSLVSKHESETRSRNLTAFDWVLLAYLLVTSLLFYRLFRQFFRILIWIRRSERFEWKGIGLIHLPKGMAPFSFFRAIFVNSEVYSNEDIGEIIQHEQAHIRQGHTYDVLFGELVCVLFWMNPFAWLLKRRMRENLEFLADQHVLHKGFDPKTYQYHLLQLSCQRSDANLANHFNVTQLKTRIVMMNKKRTSWAGLGKYTLSIPLFAALLLTAYAWGQQNETKAKALIAQATAESKLAHALTTSKTTTNKITTQTKAPTVKSTTINIKQSIYPAITEHQESKNRTLMVYNKPDKPAEFPGGIKTFTTFFKNNLKFPNEALLRGEQGWLYIQFIINEYGILMDYKIINPSPNRIFKMEFGRVCDEARKIAWKPAEKEGKKIAISFVLPFVFRFEGEYPVNESTLPNCITVVAKRNKVAEKTYQNRTYATNAEVMPQFPGGHSALFSYLERELRNPQSGNDCMIPVSFVVEKNGAINQVQVNQPEAYDPVYLAEAIRVVKEMPAWSPGVEKGQKVAVSFILPILFYPHMSLSQKVDLISNKNSSSLLVYNGRPMKTDIQKIDSDTMRGKNWASLLHIESEKFRNWKTIFIKTEIPILVNADQPYVHDLIAISAD